MAETNLHPEQEVQKRRSTRIVQAVPLTVTGVDALGRPFQERTSTLIINCHGARYQSKHYVLKNMWVTLEVPHNEPGHEARSVRGRVTWIQRPRTVRELFQIGVELEVSGNVWGIAFPPADWFPFPESGAAAGLQVSPPFESEEPAHETEEWSTEKTRVVPPVEPAESRVEDNLRVLPLPTASDPSVQFARQMARMVAEAKQQIQNTVRESATQAVAAETRPLLAALQTQLNDAAQKSVAAAVASHLEKSQQETLRRMESEREAGMASMLEQLSGELERRLGEAREKIDIQLADVERTRRADFEAQIQNQLAAATQKLEALSGNVGANQDQLRAAMDQLKESSAKSAADEIRRWQEQMDLRTADAQARLAQMDQTARRLGDQIAAATTLGEVGWRGLLESDLETAHKRWSEKIDALIEEASRRAAEKLASDGQASARQIEQQLQQQISVLQSARSQITAEAESLLGTLRAAITEEKSHGETVISQIQDSVGKMEMKRGELAAQVQAASDEWARLAETMLATQSAELEARRNEFSTLLQAASTEWARRAEALVATQSRALDHHAESAVTSMAERLQPMIEAAGHDTIEKLAGELEQRLASQLAGASDILGKLAFDREQAEAAVTEHQQRLWQVSERGLQDTAARGKELLAQIEKDFGESARAASGRWLAEIETRATETSHSTFESLFKSADWYEKKIQAQMQTTLEKGLDQANSRLREKAAEMSGLFASELDHYSRSYVEHARGQMQENAREAAEQGGRKIVEAGDAAAATFTDRAAQLGREQFDVYASKTKAAFEQHAETMEALTARVRSQLESDARAFAVEFQRALSQHGQQTLALGKQELGIQIDQAKDALLVETQSLERHFQASLNSLGTAAMDEHRQRLENASNSWLLTTVSKLNVQSGSLIEELANTTEKRLKTVCGDVFSEMGETLRQRLAGITSVFASPVAPASPAPSANPPEQKK